MVRHSLLAAAAEDFESSLTGKSLDLFFVSIYIYMYIYICIYIYVCVYVCMYVCMYVCIYICICICMYIYIYIHVYTRIALVGIGLEGLVSRFGVLCFGL